MMTDKDYARTGVIFNIQKFSIHDGPGIRTVVFFTGCPLRCRWCANPESQLSRVQMFWDQKKCLGCRHCMEICPADAISEREGHIHVNADRCTGCRRCEHECPGRALTGEGETKTVREVMNTVLQDLPFYEESGGGITLSGGEILMQPDFAALLLMASRENGLDTCCETTGYSRPDIFDQVTKLTDHILFDMKHWDPDRHKAGTGVTNEIPLSNMDRAVRAGKDVLPRIPVIPGFNDSLKDAAGFADTLHKIGIGRCQLLCFHQFGENKYHLLDRPYEYEDVPALHPEDLEEFRKVMNDRGINAFF